MSQLRSSMSTLSLCLAASIKLSSSYAPLSSKPLRTNPLMIKSLIAAKLSRIAAHQMMTLNSCLLLEKQISNCCWRRDRLLNCPQSSRNLLRKQNLSRNSLMGPVTRKKCSHRQCDAQSAILTALCCIISTRCLCSVLKQSLWMWKWQSGMTIAISSAE